MRGEWVKALGLGTVLIVAVAISALLDDETGVRIWRELRADLEVAHARVAALVRENEALRREIETLESEPAALDRAIREELDLALPDEIVVRFEGAAAAAGAHGSEDRHEGRETR
ncbi:MAG: septum formation initiator family protein [Deltaproteobacteria bacterium]|jgi:cell division protein FtsB|nr:septum formation initiator family protein [Deltaproteobacteria bacterium]